MILVDTSVWIDLLKKKSTRAVNEEDLLRFVTCGPIIQEVLQDLRPGHQSEMFRSNFLALPVVSDPISIALYISAADIFRLGRRRGITVRSPIDCLIAAIAIENAVPVLHQDRDFGDCTVHIARTRAYWIFVGSSVSTRARKRSLFRRT